MNIRVNTVFIMVATLGLVLSTCILTTIHSQQAFALTRTHAGTDINDVNGANGGHGGNAKGGNANGGNGGDVNGGAAIGCAIASTC